MLKNLFKHFIFTVFLLFFIISSSYGEVPRANGLYSLDTVVNMPYVSGVSTRINWADIEKTEGVYDFSGLDKTIRDAMAVNQSVTIEALTVDEPAWLIAKADPANVYLGQNDTDISPWDPKLQSSLGKLITAMANYKIDGIALKDLPAVKQIDAPLASSNGIRIQNALPPGYTAEKYNTAVIHNIALWTDTWCPVVTACNKNFFEGIFGIAQDKTNEVAISQLIISTFDGVKHAKVAAFIEFWTELNPDPSTNKLLGYFVGNSGVMMQACGSWTGQNGTFWKDKCKWVKNTSGVNIDNPMTGYTHAKEKYDVTYFELYQDDLKNAAYAAYWQAMADDIKARITPPPKNCAAQALSWGIAPALCSADMPAITSSSSASVFDTAPTAVGSVTASCSDGVVTLITPDCSIPPANCPQQTVNWRVGASSCSGLSPELNSSASAVVNDALSPGFGSVTTSCLDGAISVSNKVCTRRRQ